MNNEAQIIEMLGKVLANSTETNQRLDRIETRLDNLETRAGNLETKVDRLDASNAKIWERINMIEQQMLAIGFELKEDIKLVLVRLNHIELDAVAAKFQSIQNRNDILDLQKRLTALESKAA